MWSHIQQPVGQTEVARPDRTLINTLALSAIAFGIVGWVLVANMGEPQRKKRA